jgi:RHS repeat-associated protein
VTDTYTYDVLGAVRSRTGTSANEWRFTGELQDSRVARGLYYLRARYYDPALGRFLSRDPFMGLVNSPQSLNRYVYAVNNPVNLRDPSGMQGGGEVAVGTAGEVVCVIASGGGCVVVVGAATLVAACNASPACREAMAGAAGAAWEGLLNAGDALGDAKDWVGGLFSRGKSSPVSLPKADLDIGRGGAPMFGNGLGGKGPFGWMKKLLYVGASAAALKYSGLLDMCVPPKESKEMK